MGRYGDGADSLPGLNSRAEQLVGRHGTVLEFAESEGAIEVEGMLARSTDRETRGQGADYRCARHLAGSGLTQDLKRP